mmetsp:Transcript_67276/g.189541  ORF Transcript_67276/g.189541 Transcript_67276/m.189541 type:complete len:308 (+) Transcript_67276:241-1164(+)
MAARGLLSDMRPPIPIWAWRPATARVVLLPDMRPPVSRWGLASAVQRPELSASSWRGASSRDRHTFALFSLPRDISFSSSFFTKAACDEGWFCSIGPTMDRTVPGSDSTSFLYASTCPSARAARSSAASYFRSISAWCSAWARSCSATPSTCAACRFTSAIWSSTAFVRSRALWLISSACLARAEHDAIVFKASWAVFMNSAWTSRAESPPGGVLARWERRCCSTGEFRSDTLRASSTSDVLAATARAGLPPRAGLQRGSPPTGPAQAGRFIGAESMETTLAGRFIMMSVRVKVVVPPETMMVALEW